MFLHVFQRELKSVKLPNLGSTWPNIGPTQAQHGSKWAQHASTPPNMTQHGLEICPTWPSMDPNGPRWAQHTLKISSTKAEHRTNIIKYGFIGTPELTLPFLAVVVGEATRIQISDWGVAECFDFTGCQATFMGGHIFASLAIQSWDCQRGLEGNYQGKLIAQCNVLYCNVVQIVDVLLDVMYMHAMHVHVIIIYIHKIHIHCI